MAEITRFVTPVFRLSFPALAEAASYDGGKPKFSCSAVWDPRKFSDADKKRWQKIKGALNDEAKVRFKKAFKDLPANVKRGLRDGAEKADMEGYGEGTVFATLSTQMRPGIVDAKRTPLMPEDVANELYPGCYCRATVTIYSYDNKGKGVALGLMNMQKVADGVRLDSRTDASDDFEDDIDDEWLENSDEDAGGSAGMNEDDDIPF